MTNICQSIKCPWFSSDHKRSWGCQRYTVAAHCHLLTAHKNDPVSQRILSSTEYAIYGNDENEATIARLQAENNEFCENDDRYQRDREFHLDSPDWGGFCPGEIVS